MQHPKANSSTAHVAVALASCASSLWATFAARLARHCFTAPALTPLLTCTGPAGLHQRGPAAWFDGTSYVNLCPVAPGTTYEYEFKVSTPEQPQRNNPCRTTHYRYCCPGSPAARCTSQHAQPQTAPANEAVPAPA